MIYFQVVNELLDLVTTLCAKAEDPQIVDVLKIIRKIKKWLTAPEAVMFTSAFAQSDTADPINHIASMLLSLEPRAERYLHEEQAKKKKQWKRESENRFKLKRLRMMREVESKSRSTPASVRDDQALQTVHDQESEISSTVQLPPSPSYHSEIFAVPFSPDSLAVNQEVVVSCDDGSYHIEDDQQKIAYTIECEDAGSYVEVMLGSGEASPTSVSSTPKVVVENEQIIEDDGGVRDHNSSDDGFAAMCSDGELDDALSRPERSLRSKHYKMEYLPSHELHKEVTCQPDEYKQFDTLNLILPDHLPIVNPKPRPRRRGISIWPTRVPYICPYCRAIRWSIKNIKAHLNLCHGKAPASCLTCRSNFRNGALASTFHSCALLAPCPKCHKPIRGKLYVEEHMEEHHAEQLCQVDQITCLRCQTHFPSLIEAKVHANHEHDTSMMCDSCLTPLSDKSQVSLGSTKLRFYCNTCQREAHGDVEPLESIAASNPDISIVKVEVFNRPDWIAHLLNPASFLGDGIECRYCQIVYANIRMYESHLMNRHRHVGDGTPCDRCGTFSLNREMLRIHTLLWCPNKRSSIDDNISHPKQTRSEILTPAKPACAEALSLDSNTHESRVCILKSRSPVKAHSTRLKSAKPLSSADPKPGQPSTPQAADSEGFVEDPGAVEGDVIDWSEDYREEKDDREEDDWEEVEEDSMVLDVELVGGWDEPTGHRSVKSDPRSKKWKNNLHKENTYQPEEYKLLTTSHSTLPPELAIVNPRPRIRGRLGKVWPDCVPYICQYCRALHWTAERIKSHHNYHHKDATAVCRGCRRSYVNGELATTLHLCPHVWPCPKCHKTCKSRVYYEEHLLEHRAHDLVMDDQITCQTCQINFPDLIEAKIHADKEHNTSMMCDSCLTPLSDKSQVCLGSTKLRFYCNTCQQKAQGDEEPVESVAASNPGISISRVEVFILPDPILILLNKTTAPPVGFNCAYCTTFQETISLYHKHLAQSHRDTADGKVCELCGISFINYEMYLIHVLYCVGEKKAKFPNVELKEELLSFRSALAQFKHANPQRKEKAHLHCECCGVTYARKSGFTVHKHSAKHIRNSNRGDQHLPCGTCGKIFQSNVQLWRHQKQKHGGEVKAEPGLGKDSGREAGNRRGRVTKRVLAAKGLPSKQANSTSDSTSSDSEDWSDNSYADSVSDPSPMPVKLPFTNKTRSVPKSLSVRKLPKCKASVGLTRVLDERPPASESEDSEEDSSFVPKVSITLTDHPPGHSRKRAHPELRSSQSTFLKNQQPESHTVLSVIGKGRPSKRQAKQPIIKLMDFRQLMKPGNGK